MAIIVAVYVYPAFRGYERVGGKKVVVTRVRITHAGRQQVKDHLPEFTAPDCRHSAGHLWLEVLIVALAGAAFAFAANRISPRGLTLARNYFLVQINRPVAMPGTIAWSRDLTNSGSPVLSPVQLLTARLKEQGLQLLDGGQVKQLFQDPQFKIGNIVFVDARDEAHYHEGHIPGAYEFDPYYPEKYFTNVLPACQAARQIVVYCNGGDCDDSESAALTLRDVGIPVSELFIYGGGIPEWTTNGWPVEIGARNSGSLRRPNQ